MKLSSLFKRCVTYGVLLWDMCVLHGAGNLQANLHLTHGLPRLASSPHLTAHNPHPPCRPEKEEEVGATKGPSLWSAGM